MKSSRKAKGFSIVEIILLILFILILILLGWYVWQKRSKKVPAPQSQSAQQQSTPAKKTDPKDSWKSETLTYEKIKLKHPDDWKYEDIKNPNSDLVSDKMTLISPNGLYIRVETGLFGIGGDCMSCKNLKSDPVTMLGATHYMDYTSQDGGPEPDYIQVGDKDCAGLCGIDGTTLKAEGGQKTIILISIYYPGAQQGQYKSKTLAAWQSDSDVATAKDILSTMTY